MPVPHLTGDYHCLGALLLLELVTDTDRARERTRHQPGDHESGEANDHGDWKALTMAMTGRRGRLRDTRNTRVKVSVVAQLASEWIVAEMRGRYIAARHAAAAPLSRTRVRARTCRHHLASACRSQVEMRPSTRLYFFISAPFVLAAYALRFSVLFPAAADLATIAK